MHSDHLCKEKADLHDYSFDRMTWTAGSHDLLYRCEFVTEIEFRKITQIRISGAVPPSVSYIAETQAILDCWLGRPQKIVLKLTIISFYLVGLDA